MKTLGLLSLLLVAGCSVGCSVDFQEVSYSAPCEKPKHWKHLPPKFSAKGDTVITVEVCE